MSARDRSNEVRNEQVSLKVHPLPALSVDSHAHVLGANPPIDQKRHPGQIPTASVDQYLQLLDDHGVTFGLLTAPSFYGADNAVLLDALSRGAGRLKATAIVEPDIDEKTLSALQTMGVCGIRLNWIRLHEKRPDLNSANYRNLLSKARNIGLHIELYVEGEYLDAMMPALASSGVNLVIDHFGHPHGQHQATQSSGFQTVLRALDAGHTWIKLSAPYRLRDCEPAKLATEILLRDHGAERVVWGTDWPWLGHHSDITYQSCIDHLFEWVPDAAQRHCILVDTPHKLFGFTNQSKEEFQ